jgi:hypothetical protein
MTGVMEETTTEAQKEVMIQKLYFEKLKSNIDDKCEGPS